MGQPATTLNAKLSEKIAELNALAEQIPEQTRKQVTLNELETRSTQLALEETYDPAPGTDAALDCLTPAQLEDKQLVEIIRSIGRPPPFQAGKTHQFTGYHMAWLCQFLYSIPSPQMAANIIGCSVETFYHHRRINKQFKDYYDDAIAAGFQAITGAAAENALGVGDPDVLSRRSEKLLGAFLLRESRTKIDVEVEHSGGVILIPQPLSQDEFERVVFDQQQRHRENYQDSLGDARRSRSKSVIIDHDPGPTPPSTSQTNERRAAGGAIELQSEPDRPATQPQRGANRVVRSY